MTTSLLGPIRSSLGSKSFVFLNDIGLTAGLCGQQGPRPAPAFATAALWASTLLGRAADSAQVYATRLPDRAGAAAEGAGTRGQGPPHPSGLGVCDTNDSTPLMLAYRGVCQVFLL